MTGSSFSSLLACGGFLLNRLKTGVKMIKKYNVIYHKKIEVVEITRETAASVWMLNSCGNEVKSLKRTSDGWNDFFDTYEEARQHVIKFNELKIEKSRQSIESAELAIKNALEWSEK
jgi:hypothetical protein